MAEREGQHWSLDKRVPLAIIFALMIQTLAAVWWMGTFSASMEQRVKTLEETTASKANLSDRMVVVETKMGNISDALTRIESKLDQRIDSSPPDHGASNRKR